MWWRHGNSFFSTLWIDLTAEIPVFESLRSSCCFGVPFAVAQALIRHSILLSIQFVCFFFEISLALRVISYSFISCCDYLPFFDGDKWDGLNGSSLSSGNNQSKIKFTLACCYIFFKLLKKFKTLNFKRIKIFTCCWFLIEQGMTFPLMKKWSNMAAGCLLLIPPWEKKTITIVLA